MKVQASPWKPSDTVNVVAGTSLVGLSLFKSGSDEAITTFASPIRVTIPVPAPPAGKQAKIVFWDASAGKYSDAGCTAVVASQSTHAVADCNHLTDFGVTYVDSGSANVTGTAVCGNYAVETNEECDDGNSLSGDGCSSTCKKEFPVIEKPNDSPSATTNTLAIALGAGLGGLFLILLCVLYVRHKYGRVLFCLGKPADGRASTSTELQTVSSSDVQVQKPTNPNLKSVQTDSIKGAETPAGFSEPNMLEVASEFSTTARSTKGVASPAKPARSPASDVAVSQLAARRVGGGSVLPPIVATKVPHGSSSTDSPAKVASSPAKPARSPVAVTAGAVATELAVDLGDLDIAELRKMCKRKGISILGSKEELRARLSAAEASTASELRQA